MKIKIEVDCTPEEARTFLGLPDVQPMQEAIMNEMQDKMMASMSMLDPETALKTIMPLGGQGLEQFQKMMFTAAKTAMKAGSEVASSAAKSTRRSSSKDDDDA